MTPVSLRERIQSEVIAAMRSGNALRRDVLRMALNAAYNVEKRQQKPLTDDEFVAVLAHEVKTRRESIEAFEKGARPDLVAREASEVAILQEFLPAALSEDDLRVLVEEAVGATGATSARDLGKMMGWLSPRTRGRADGRRVSELVAQRLASADLASHDGPGTHPPAGHGGRR